MTVLAAGRALRWLLSLALFVWLWLSGASWPVLIACAWLFLRSEGAAYLHVQRYQDDVRLAQAIRDVYASSTESHKQTTAALKQLHLALCALPASKH